MCSQCDVICFTLLTKCDIECYTLYMKEVVKQNPQWREKSFDVPKHKRLLYKTILKDIKVDPICYLTGGRRLGKSVIFKQLINHIVDGGTNPKQLLFFEFSSGDTVEKLEQVFDFFVGEVADQSEKMFVFFDEIQYIEKYQNIIKLLYDMHKGKVKFFLTGSLSLLYRLEDTKDLTGRFFSYRLLPLSFEEFLQISEDKRYRLFCKGKDIFEGLDYDSALDRGILTGIVDELGSTFVNFLQSGRYPETVNFSREQLTSYLDTLIAHSLSRDAFTYFSIERPDVLFSIFEHLRKNNGGELSFRKIASQLNKVDDRTVKKYIDVLEILGLIYIVRNSINVLSYENSFRKIYLNSEIVSSMNQESLEKIGTAVESYVLEMLINRGYDVAYYRKRQKEIDFLVPKQKLAYEIKYRNKISLKLPFENLQALNKYQKFIVTRNQCKRVDNVEFSPAMFF